MEKKDLIDPLEQIFEQLNSSESDNSLELFRDESDDIDLKTQLAEREQVLSTCIATESLLIKNSIDWDGYDLFLNNFMRTKVSLNRESRKEFVQVNMQNTLDRDLNRVSNLKNLSDPRS